MLESPEIRKLATEFAQQNLREFLSIGKGMFKTASKEIQFKFSNAFEDYISRCGTRLERAKSFFVKQQSASLYEFYIPLSLRSNENTLAQVSFRKLNEREHRCIITASAGSGKSMLMKHFFLSCISETSVVPVFVELREIKSGDTAIQEKIYETMSENGFDLGDQYISRAISGGKIAVLLDGFDEVKHEFRRGIADQIMKFTRLFRDCTVIISSRPDDFLTGWDEFTTYRICPLTKEEALELVKKLRFDEDIKAKFLRELEFKLYEEHSSFMSNPLLLSIMLLTYGQAGDIPKKRSVFYNLAYDALFQRHDALKAGYKRDRKTSLDIQDFAKVFSAFCYLTYDKREFQFSRMDAINYLDKVKEITNCEYESSDFLDDAIQSVCLLVEEGIVIVFSHRSFQEYFVAKFINESNRRHQSALLLRVSKNIRADGVVGLLYELNQDLVERELLIPALEETFDQIGATDGVERGNYVKLMKRHFSALSIRSDGVALTITDTLVNTIDLLAFAIQRVRATRFLTNYSAKEIKESEELLRKEYGAEEFPTDEPSDESDHGGVEVVRVSLRDKSEVDKIWDLIGKSFSFWSFQTIVALHKLLQDMKDRQKQLDQSLGDLLGEKYSKHNS